MSEQNLSASIGSAFQGAVSEHSAPPAPAEPAERAAAPSEPAPATSPQDGQATTDEAHAQPPVDDGAELLTKQEIESLKGDPVAIEKAFKSAFTKKTQALSAQMKQLEPLTKLLTEFQTNPQQTLQLLASQHGMTLTPAQQAAVAETPSDQELLEAAYATYDPQQIAQAQKTVMENQFNRMQQDFEKKQQSARQTDDTLAQFTQKHPDWKQHEQQINALAAKFLPQGVTGLEYMEMLYHMATKDKTEAQKTKEVLERMKASAEKSESPNGGVPNNVVAQRPPKPANLNAAFKNAFEDARRGVRYE